MEEIEKTYAFSYNIYMNPEQPTNPETPNPAAPNVAPPTVPASVTSNPVASDAPPVPLNFSAPPPETDAVLPAQTNDANAAKKEKKKGMIMGIAAASVLLIAGAVFAIINLTKKEEVPKEDQSGDQKYVDVKAKKDEKLDEDDDDEIPEGMQREHVADLKSGEIKLNYLEDMPDAKMSEEGDSDDNSVLYNGAYFVDGSYVSIKQGIFESDVENQAVFVVANGGILKLSKDVKVNKKASAKNDPDTSLAELGTNAAIVVFGEKSKVYINGTEINTTAKSAKAIYGAKGSKIEIKNATINTTNTAASGISTTFGASVLADASIIKTSSKDSPIFESRLGAGEITATNMNITTGGLNSPLVSAVSNVSMTKVTGSANGSQMFIMEGEGSISLDSCKVSANGHGSLEDNSDSAGILFRKVSRNEAMEIATGVGSEPVDTPASFTANDSELSILTSSNLYDKLPMFNSIEKNANISLKNVQATFSKEAKYVKATGAKLVFTEKNVTVPNKDLDLDEKSEVEGLPKSEEKPN